MLQVFDNLAKNDANGLSYFGKFFLISRDLALVASPEQPSRHFARRTVCVARDTDGRSDARATGLHDLASSIEATAPSSGLTPLRQLDIGAPDLLRRSCWQLCDGIALRRVVPCLRESSGDVARDLTRRWNAFQALPPRLFAPVA
jgi:hypothetical protein